MHNCVTLMHDFLNASTMKTSKFTIHVPMKRELYDKLKERAEIMGFDSPQAYIRFWAASETTEIKRGGVGYYNLSSAKSPSPALF